MSSQCISKQAYDNGQSDNFGHYLTKSKVIIAYDRLINDIMYVTCIASVRMWYDC